VNEGKDSYTYDGNNNRTEWLFQTWDGTAWVNYYKHLYTYDGNNNQTEWLYQEWDGSAWVNILKYSYTYTPATAINEEFNSVYSYSLSNNYPNPFNPSTKIKYSIPNESKVIIKVYDVLGKEIETLVSEEKPAGTYEVTWYAENLPSGVYFYQLKAGSFVETKKMILLK